MCKSSVIRIIWLIFLAVIQITEEGRQHCYFSGDSGVGGGVAGVVGWMGVGWGRGGGVGGGRAVVGQGLWGEWCAGEGYCGWSREVGWWCR